MNHKANEKRFVAFLRGINVGGHNKIPMHDLCNEFERLRFTNVVSILNSGNVIFDSAITDPKELEILITDSLKNRFGFSVPTIIRGSAMLRKLLHEDPFKDIELTKDHRLYISFSKEEIQTDLKLPWISPDKSFKIIENKQQTIFSVLDLSISKTPRAMEALEKFFGKDITTRNRKTIERINDKL